MARIPLEDNYTDVIGKAQRGLKITDAQLSARAEVSLADLAAIKAGKVDDAAIRRIGRHLRLGPHSLEALANNRYYPETPDFKRGFAMFNTPYEDMRVNSYLIWDTSTKQAAAFDTGATCDSMLDLARAEKLKIGYIFITHSHEDHIADLPKLAKETGAAVWASELEPVNLPGAMVFAENAHFHIGSLAVKTLLTPGHSPGLTTFFVTGLSWPLAIVGDALFSGSIGGSQTRYQDQYESDRDKIFTLARDTVIACGHGPLTTLAQEKAHNPFFAR